MSGHADPIATPAPRPLLSVVVIGRNEGDRLGRCFDSITAMERSGFELEVIYVDSGSSDHSLALAERARIKVVALQPEKPSAALARNAGWRMAAGELILFLDGDTILHPHFVAASLPSFQAREVAVVWGHRRELFPRRSIYNRVLDLDWIYKPGWSLFCGGDALVRRSVLLATGGFDERLIAGEEPELCRRILGLGLKILHVDHPMTGHDLAITHWAQYWRRAVRAGHAFAEVSERFRSTEHPFWLDVAQGNARRALLLLLSLATAIAASIGFRTLWPLALLCFALLVLVTRSAWKARWKSSDTLGLLLYGVHSHLQQVPIYVGQLHFRRSRRQGRQVGLIEYNRPQ